MSGTPASSSPGITGFIEIFEGRLIKMKLHLKEELNKSKGERNRKLIKSQLSDARKLNKTLKEMRNAAAKKCPHCGEKL
jgi:predicted metallo-beta-lactamase superfamily hydrolase